MAHVPVAERGGKEECSARKDKKETRFTTFCIRNPVHCRAPLAKPLAAGKQHKTLFKLYVWQNDKNRHNTLQEVHIRYHLCKSKTSENLLNFSKRISSKLSVNSIMQKTFSWKFHISVSLELYSYPWIDLESFRSFNLVLISDSVSYCRGWDFFRVGIHESSSNAND